MSLQLEFERAGWAQTSDGFVLQLFVKNKGAAVEFIKNMIKGKSYCAELKEYRKKRSLDANAYFWVLCDKLASKTNTQKTDVYKNAIKDIGGNSDTVCVVEKAADKLCTAWERNGAGWFCERFDSKISGCVNVTLYYGSSVYDSAQMARLIDNIVQDCKAVGIETATPAELSVLMQEWGR